MKLRVMTANLWNGGAEPGALADLLESLRPDVLAVQELSEDQAEAISTVLPHGILEPRDDHHGMGIALARAARIRRIRLRGRDARVACLSPKDWAGLGSPLEVVNAHVWAPHVAPFWRTAAHRRAQLHGLLAYLAEDPTSARLLCGDFNATPAWPLYRRLARHLDDLALTHGRRLGEAPRRTWGPWPGSPRLFRIDHAFGRKLDPLDVRVLAIPGSDHSALVIDLDG
ncbi:MAG: endonuclease/exonuclease/phosphatase family protein [Myxococcales bacterium]|nr:endonuclease/exonuclease/phosphatase family protein [Myxococcales bacterium]